MALPFFSLSRPGLANVQGNAIVNPIPIESEGHKPITSSIFIEQLTCLNSANFIF